MRPVTPERLSLNTATVREQWSLQECVQGCVRHGFGGISPWRDNLQEAGVSEAAKMITDSGLAVSGLCRGGWYTAQGALNDAVLDDNKRAVDEAVAIGAACLVMVVGGLPEGSRDIQGARDMITEGLSKTLDYARTVDMPIAIEPLHPMYAGDRSCINTLGQTLDICDQLGAGIGAAVDVYHVWWDPEIFVQIERAGIQQLMAFHICDWLVPTADMLTDRGMMGDGAIDIKKLRAAVEAQGFVGLNEVEIFSAQNWWIQDPDKVLSTIIDRALDRSKLWGVTELNLRQCLLQYCKLEVQMHWWVIIEAIDPTGDTYKKEFQFEKDLDQLSDGHVGCSVEQGKMIMAEIQKIVVEREVALWIAYSRVCHSCAGSVPIKDYQTRSILTVYGDVKVRYPRLSVCQKCNPFRYSSFSPLASMCPDRATPELLELSASDLPPETSLTLM